MKKYICNLEFPSWCPEIKIFGYRFARLDDYSDRVIRLQHLGGGYAEFKIEANTGEHVVTAYVDIPDSEKKAVLEWADDEPTALSDILLLLSIFTQRDVFVTKIRKDTNFEADGVLTADPRFYQGGGILQCSIPYKGQPIEPEPYQYDIGFEEGLNKIYTLIRSKKWQLEYKGGYFLFLARMAFRRQPLETTFIQCWTIWEHLFAILNQSWLSKKQIQSLSATEKISYLLVKYVLKNELTEKDKKRIESLAAIRNRLVHFGRFPEHGSVHDNAVLFTKLTEFIIARTLNLSPSNVLNTMERLEDFLNNVGSEKPA